MSRETTKAETAKGDHARRDDGPSYLPRHPGPQARPRTGDALPPEAVRPFLDALAELLASWVVSQFTGRPGTRPNRNSEGVGGKAFDKDSAGIQTGSKGIR